MGSTMQLIFILQPIYRIFVIIGKDSNKAIGLIKETFWFLVYQGGEALESHLECQSSNDVDQGKKTLQTKLN